MLWMVLSIFAGLAVCVMGFVAHGSRWPADRMQPECTGKYLLVRHNLYGLVGVLDTIPVGSIAWYEWLETHDNLSVRISDHGWFYLRKEARPPRKNPYWYGYRWPTHGGPRACTYLGKTEGIDFELLSSAGAKLATQVRELVAKRDQERKRRRSAARAADRRERFSDSFGDAPGDDSEADPPTDDPGAEGWPGVAV